jgi:hypothetical protein
VRAGWVVECSATSVTKCKILHLIEKSEAMVNAVNHKPVLLELSQLATKPSLHEL